MSLIEGLRNRFNFAKKEEQKQDSANFEVKIQTPGEGRQAAERIYTSLTDGGNLDSISAALTEVQDANSTVAGVQIQPEPGRAAALREFKSTLTNDLIGTPAGRGSLSESTLLPHVVKLLDIATVTYNDKAPLTGDEMRNRDAMVRKALAESLTKLLLKEYSEAEQPSERQVYAKRIGEILRQDNCAVFDSAIHSACRGYEKNGLRFNYARNPRFLQQIEPHLVRLEANISQEPQDPNAPVLVTELQTVIDALLNTNPPVLNLPWHNDPDGATRTQKMVADIAQAVAVEHKAKYEKKTMRERLGCFAPIGSLIDSLQRLTTRKKGESSEPRVSFLIRGWRKNYTDSGSPENAKPAVEATPQELLAGITPDDLMRIIENVIPAQLHEEYHFPKNDTQMLQKNMEILLNYVRSDKQNSKLDLVKMLAIHIKSYIQQSDRRPGFSGATVNSTEYGERIAREIIGSLRNRYEVTQQQKAQPEATKKPNKEKKGSLSLEDRKHAAEFIENNWEELENAMDDEPALDSLKRKLLVAFKEAKTAQRLLDENKSQPEDKLEYEEDIAVFHELCVRFLVYAQLLGVKLPNNGSYADLLKQEVKELPEASKDQLDAYENLALFVENNQNHILRQAVIARNDNKITRQTLKQITDALLDITNTKKGISAETAIGRKESSEKLLHALTRMLLAGVDIQLETPYGSNPDHAYTLKDFVESYASDEYAKMVDELKAGNFTKEQKEWIVDLQHASIDRTWKGKFKNFFKNNKIELAGFAVGAGGMWVANEFQRRGMHIDAYMIKMGVQFYGSAMLSTLGFVPAQLRVIQGKQLIARTLEEKYDPNKKYLGFIPSLPKQFAWLDSVSTHGFYRFTHALVTGAAFENLAEMYMGPHMHFSDGTEAQMADAPEPQAETVQMSSALEIADTIAHGDFSRIEAALDGVVDVNTGEPISLEGYHALGGAIDIGDGDYQVILDKVGQVGAGEISAGDIKVAIFSEGTMRFSINTIDDAGQARWEPLETVAIPVPVATESPAPHEGAGEDADTDSTATAETDDQTYERPEEFIENFENLEPGVKEQIEVEGRQVAHYVEEGVVVTGYQQAYVVQLDSEGHALHSFKGDMLLVPTSLDGFDTDHIVPLATGSDAQHEFVIPQMGHSGEEPQTGDLVARFRGAQVEWFIYDEVNVPGADSVPASVPLKGVLHGDIPELAESYAELRNDLADVAKDISIHVPGTLPEGWEVGADGEIVPIEPDAGEVPAEGGEGDGNLFDQLESDATGAEDIATMDENRANAPEVQVAAPTDGDTDAATSQNGEVPGDNQTDADSQGVRELGPLHPETIANLEVDTEVRFNDQNAWKAVERVLNSSESLDVQNGCIVFTPENGEPVPTTVTYDVAVDFGEDVAAGLQARAAEKLGIPEHELAPGDKVVYVDQFDSVEQMDKWLETKGRELGVQGVVVSDEGMGELLKYGTHMNDGELPEKWDSALKEIINERFNALDATGPQGAAGDRGGLGKVGVLEEPVLGKDTALMDAMLDVAQGEKPDATLRGSGLLDLVDGKPGGIPVNPEDGTPIQEPLTSETIIARADANEGSATVTGAEQVETPAIGQVVTPEQLDSYIAEGWGALEANHPILNGVVHEDAAQGALEHYARVVMGAGSENEVAIKFTEFAAAGDGEYVVKLATMTNEAMNDYVADLQGTGLDPLQAEVADHAKGLSPMDRILVRAAQGIDDNLTVTINGQERDLSPEDQHAILVRAMSNPAITELASGTSYNEARIDGAIAAADIQDPLLYAGNQELYNQEVLGK